MTVTGSAVRLLRLSPNDIVRITTYVKVKFKGYLGVSVALEKEGAAGWRLGDRPPPPMPRAALYSSSGDWKATWGSSGGGRGISPSRTPIFTLLGKPLDEVSPSPVADGSNAR